ncbi:hypothetical protein HaLaN_22163 [Haematococcus lacustris]|uniref:Uncharacterized protein n=1 Tax=Haematococcus lacustris TaxID=44745 RepID=A0A699ZNH9_HAELA|nr:hypothetical protein HaLaN_22163 [Haematococcus lacustris]
MMWLAPPKPSAFRLLGRLSNASPTRVDKLQHESTCLQIFNENERVSLKNLKSFIVSETERMPLPSMLSVDPPSVAFSGCASSAVAAALWRQPSQSQHSQSLCNTRRTI